MLNLKFILLLILFFNGVLFTPSATASQQSPLEFSKLLSETPFHVEFSYESESPPLQQLRDALNKEHPESINDLKPMAMEMFIRLQEETSGANNQIAFGYTNVNHGLWSYTADASGTERFLIQQKMAHPNPNKFSDISPAVTIYSNDQIFVFNGLSSGELDIFSYRMYTDPRRHVSHLFTNAPFPYLVGLMIKPDPNTFDSVFLHEYHHVYENDLLLYSEKVFDWADYYGEGSTTTYGIQVDYGQIKSSVSGVSIPYIETVRRTFTIQRLDGSSYYTEVTWNTTDTKIFNDYFVIPSRGMVTSLVDDEYRSFGEIELKFFEMGDHVLDEREFMPPTEYATIVSIDNELQPINMNSPEQFVNPGTGNVIENRYFHQIENERRLQQMRDAISAE